jgi:hypothetical protein
MSIFSGNKQDCSVTSLKKEPDMKCKARMKVIYSGTGFCRAIVERMLGGHVLMK